MSKSILTILLITPIILLAQKKQYNQNFNRLTICTQDSIIKNSKFKVKLDLKSKTLKMNGFQHYISIEEQTKKYIIANDNYSRYALIIENRKLIKMIEYPIKGVPLIYSKR